MMDELITNLLYHYLSFVVGVIGGWWLKTFHLYFKNFVKKYYNELKKEREKNSKNFKFY